MKIMKTDRLIFLLFILVLVIFTTGCVKKEIGESETSNITTSQQAVSQQGEIDLTNIKTLADLLALGKGIVCDVQTSRMGYTVNIKYYIKSNKFKVEGQTKDGSFVHLRPGDGYVYIKPLGATVPQIPGMNCVWFKFKEEEPVERGEAEGLGEGIEAEAGSIDTPVDDINWKCYEEDLSDAIFAPPSNACSFEDFIQILQKGYI